MPKYALLKNGVFQNVILAEADFDPGPGFTKEPFDKTIHFKPPQPEVEAEREWINQFRFISELHTPEQKWALNLAHKAGMGLTRAEDISTDMTLTTAEGYPVMALKIIVMAYEEMNLLKENVDLKSDGMAQFFEAAKGCGVYGFEAAAADAEIARIKRNEEPA